MGEGVNKKRPSQMTFPPEQQTIRTKTAKGHQTQNERVQIKKWRKLARDVKAKMA